MKTFTLLLITFILSTNLYASEQKNFGTADHGVDVKVLKMIEMADEVRQFLADNEHSTGIIFNDEHNDRVMNVIVAWKNSALDRTIEDMVSFTSDRPKDKDGSSKDATTNRDTGHIKIYELAWTTLPDDPSISLCAKRKALLSIELAVFTDSQYSYYDRIERLQELFEPICTAKLELDPMDPLSGLPKIPNVYEGISTNNTIRQFHELQRKSKESAIILYRLPKLPPAPVFIPKNKPIPPCNSCRTKDDIRRQKQEALQALNDELERINRNNCLRNSGCRKNKYYP